MEAPRILNIIYSIIAWGFIVIFIKPGIIKKLLPVSIISALVLFVSEHYLHTLGLTEFHNPLLRIGGMPFFHLVYGAGAGIVFMYFITKKPKYKLILVVIFTLVHQALNLVAEKLVNAHSMAESYTIWHHLYFDFLSILLVLFLSEQFFGKRIYSDN